MAGKKYAHLVLDKVVSQHRPFEPMNSPFAVGTPDFWKGVPGAVGQFAFYYVLRTGMFAEPPHSHKNDEYLMFISSDPKDMKKPGRYGRGGLRGGVGKIHFQYFHLRALPQGCGALPHLREKTGKAVLPGAFLAGRRAGALR